MKSFDGLGLHAVLATSLTHMKYTTPTPIQAQAIPLALQGRDIMGSAQTGTGKTAAFAIPLVQALLEDERKNALVMTPTRELGKQVMDIMRQLIGPKGKLKTAFLIGGESMHRQCSQLNKRPRLVVGTPGRINDHLERGNLHLDDTRFLVLDETDRMLDMGFSIQIDKIVKHMPKQRQTLMFSATMPKNIMQMADKYLIKPERIAVGSTTNVAQNLDQKVMKVTLDNKYVTLCGELEERNGSIIVFMKTKRNADRMAKKLSGNGHEAVAIHGDLQQRKRDRVITDFRAKKFRILVGTDVIARGLDIPHVEHVINYDLPQMPEDYIHRIGRTARAGAKGCALNLITPQDGRKWRAIEQLMDPDTEDPSGQSYGNHKPRSNGPRKPHRGKGGKPFGGKKYEGKKKFGDKPFKGKPFKKRSEGGQNTDRPFEEREAGFNERKKPAHKKSTSRSRDFAENRSPEGRPTEGHKFKGKKFEGKKFQGRKSEGTKFEGRSAEGRKSEGRKFEGKKFAGKKFEGKKKFSGGKPAGKPSHRTDGNQPQSRRKPSGNRNAA